MALTLTQFFESELNLEELKTIILNEEFQIQRNKDLKLSNYEISSKALSNLIINKVLEIDQNCVKVKAIQILCQI